MELLEHFGADWRQDNFGVDMRSQYRPTPTWCRSIPAYEERDSEIVTKHRSIPLTVSIDTDRRKKEIRVFTRFEDPISTPEVFNNYNLSPERFIPYIIRFSATC